MRGSVVCGIGIGIRVTVIGGMTVGVVCCC